MPPDYLDARNHLLGHVGPAGRALGVTFQGDRPQAERGGVTGDADIVRDPREHVRLRVHVHVDRPPHVDKGTNHEACVTSLSVLRVVGTSSPRSQRSSESSWWVGSGTSASVSEDEQLKARVFTHLLLAHPGLQGVQTESAGLAIEPR